MKKQGFEYLSGDAKRSLDLLGGMAISGLLLPALASGMAISAADTRSNPFFRQERLGVGGQIVDVLKFRTIKEPESPGDLKLFGTYDPRASGVGTLLRETGLDELPQLYNVIRGDMSLVGIRPLPRQEIENYRRVAPRQFKDWLEAYIQVKPGLTGPSQLLRHRYRALTDDLREESMRIDMDYVEDASLLGDLRILGKTPLELLDARIHLVDNEAETSIA